MPRFAPGVSGNPSGSQRSPRTAIQKLLAPHLEQIAETILAKALQGDVQASCAVLDLYSATTPRSRSTSAV